MISFSPTLKKAGKRIFAPFWVSPVQRLYTAGRSSWSGHNQGAAADIVKEVRPLKHTYLCLHAWRTAVHHTVLMRTEVRAWQYSVWWMHTGILTNMATC